MSQDQFGAIAAEELARVDAENARLWATIARVEALCDEAEGGKFAIVSTDYIRAALKGDK